MMNLLKLFTWIASIFEPNMAGLSDDETAIIKRLWYASRSLTFSDIESYTGLAEDALELALRSLLLKGRIRLDDVEDFEKYSLL